MCVYEILLQTWKNFIEAFVLLNQAMGRTEWTKRSAMSGLSVLTLLWYHEKKLR